MKTLFFVLIGCITLTLSSQLWADCYRGGKFTSCRSCEASSPYVTTCQCTDQGVGRNNSCMSTAKYCEAFGNVGGR